MPKQKSNRMSPKGNMYFMDMKISSNIIPPRILELNDDEMKFFENFHQLLLLTKLEPKLVRLTRLADGTFNVYYQDCYLGKISLYCPPPSYSVIKVGNKHPSKSFRSIEDAQDFVSSKGNYKIITNTFEPETYMQYTIGTDDFKSIHDLSLEDAIDYTHHWIRQIKYYLKK